jgi:sugar O-acyltransferase (sialic acid O-acetyltransferase NeuD family)
MTRPLIILGTGGNAYDVLDVVDAINAVAPAWELAGLLDDIRPSGSRYLGLKVLGPLRDAGRFQGHDFANAIGSDRSYRYLPEILASTGLTADRFATLVHPIASVSARARLGRGVTVNHGVSVGGGAVIGDFVTLCPGCIIGHDAQVGDYSILAPGATISGFVHVERGCYVGARAVIRQQLRIGERTLVGMGAVVVREVAPGMAVVGNPARPLQRSERSDNFKANEGDPR